MDIIVRVPSVFQSLTRDQAEVTSQGFSVKELLENLERAFPGFKSKVCDADGKIHKFINIYVNEDDVRFSQHEETQLNEGDTVTIVPAISGG